MVMCKMIFWSVLLNNNVLIQFKSIRRYQKHQSNSQPWCSYKLYSHKKSVIILNFFLKSMKFVFVVPAMSLYENHI